MEVPDTRSAPHTVMGLVSGSGLGFWHLDGVVS